MFTKKMRKFKKLVIFCLLVLTIIIVVIYTCDRLVENAAKGRLYSDTNDIPFNKTGLVLGTSKYLSNGYVNPYYQYRLDAALALKRSGKIRYLLISGDNSRKDYSEPEDMRADFMRLGIDSTDIFLDHAGFRTFDSMVRLREIFGQQKVTIISQKFHNERALYIAKRESINAIAYNAQDVGNRSGLRVKMREKLARVKVFVDYIFGNKPKFLGDKIIIS